MEALDVLEKRVDALNDLLGPIPDEEVSKGGENLTDSLTSAHTLLTSALSGRENIVGVLNRTEELENYLDPNFLDDKQDVKAQEVYINTIATELAGNFEMLEKIKSLEPTLGAEYFSNIPDATGKLKELSNATSEQKDQSEMIEQSIILAIQRYSEIQAGIKESLKKMNDRIDELEQRLTKKKKDENV
uniref:Putative dynactin 3 p24 subunit isoform a n=1 Tax=Lutzomyia longipalpis TaxID=7200 RepID=A0A1B0CMK9_LUTLO